MLHIVLVGNLTIGYHAVGPFENYAAAQLYVDTQLARPTLGFIFALYPPEVSDAP